MPGCAKSEWDPKPKEGTRNALFNWRCLLVLLLALSGCTRSPEQNHFEIGSLRALWTDGRLNVGCEQQLQLSAKARNALLHGVPLTITLDLIIRELTSQARVYSETWHYEIRFLPLSEHYRVTGVGRHGVGTFPRLRHALTALSSLHVSISTGALPAGEYEVLVRSHLDYRNMPPPMRLPVLLDPQWKHASDWTSQPFTVRADA